VVLFVLSDLERKQLGLELQKCNRSISWTVALHCRRISACREVFPRRRNPG